MRQVISLTDDPPHLLEGLPDVLRRRASGDPESVGHRTAAQPPGTTDLEKMNRCVLERVIASRLSFTAKRPEGGSDERQVDQSEQREQPWQKKHRPADRARRIIGEHEGGEHQELDDERDDRSPEEPANEAAPGASEQSSLTRAGPTRARRRPGGVLRHPATRRRTSRTCR